MKDQKVILEYLAQAIAHTQDSNQAKPHIRRALRLVNGHGWVSDEREPQATQQRMEFAVKSLRRASREELSNGAKSGVLMALGLLVLDTLEAQQ